MTKIQRLMRLHRLMDSAGDAGSDTGGTGTGTGAGDAGGKGNGDTAGDAGAGAGTTAGDAGAGDAGDAGEKGNKGEEGDNKPKLSDAEAKLVRDLMKHKGRANQLEGEVNTLRSQLDAFKGIDPAKVTELIQREQEAERAEMERRGEYDRIVEQMAARNREATDSLRGELDTAHKTVAELQAQIAELTVGSAFAGSQFVTETTLTPNKARVVYGSHFEYKDGRIVGYDKPAGASDRTLLVDEQGSPLSFDKALAALVNQDPDRDQLLRSKARPGSASNPAQVPPGARIQPKKQNLSPAEKISAGLRALANGGGSA